MLWTGFMIAVRKWKRINEQGATYHKDGAEAPANCRTPQPYTRWEELRENRRGDLAENLRRTL